MEKDQLYKKVGGNLASRRRELQKTQGDVARLAGISRPSLANIESGRQALTLHQIYKLAAVLELSDAKSLLPEGNTAVAGEGIESVPIKNKRLSRNQMSEIQKVIAKTAGNRS